MASELQKLEVQSEKVLFRCQTIFPFTIFPTYLELTPSRLTIKRMILPFTFHTTPVFLKDISIVRLTENPFFATLSIDMLPITDDPKPIRFLHPAEAKKMEELMVGCIEAIKKHVSTVDGYRREEQLQKIGKTKQI